MQKEGLLNLKKRYLVWLYKVTKESLDRIERKFTQLEIDRHLLEELKKEDKTKELGKFIAEFEVYIRNKEKDGLSLKYTGKNLRPDYKFINLKLKTIEKAIVKELGNKGLAEIKSLYEREMTERILKSTEQK